MHGISECRKIIVRYFVRGSKGLGLMRSSQSNVLKIDVFSHQISSESIAILSSFSVFVWDSDVRYAILDYWTSGFEEKDVFECCKYMK